MILIVSLMILGCSSPHSIENRVTEENYMLVNIQHANKYQSHEPYRFWGDIGPKFLLDDVNGSDSLNVAGDRLNVLALSGGGANGAFGAGVINGLYDSAKLPDYTIITGVSAGALIAPFVFVGGEDIHKLRDAMFKLNDHEVLGNKSVFNIFFKDAYTSGERLLSLIESTYDEEMISQIAEKHIQGKRLFIGTTHFDSGKQITWNLGEIASSNLPNKSALIHQVLAASSSIPGVFPPQFINVEYQGEQLKELHVDGGLTFQMFFNPSSFDYGKLSTQIGLERNPNVHVIRNGTLQAHYQQLRGRGIELLTRSVSNLTLQQTRGDMYRMLYTSKRDNYDIAFTYIDTAFHFEKEGNKIFDEEYMAQLYSYGYLKAQSGKLWTSQIPH